MIFSVPFRRNFKDLDNPDIELIIDYKPEIKNLNDFINQYKTHKIVLRFGLYFEYTSMRDLPILKALNEKYPDVIIAAIEEYQKDVEKELTENNILHYYNQWVDSIDIFNGFLTLNITDIFVANELCFCMEDLAAAANEKNIRLRTYGNLAQSNWYDAPAMKSFFIRPEDLHLYEGILDVFEFFFPDKEYESRLNVLYEIYKEDRTWAGPLKQIIFNFNSECDSRHLVALFGIKRLNCHKKCAYSYKGKHYVCRACELFSQLADSLKENHLVVKFEK